MNHIVYEENPSEGFLRAMKSRFACKLYAAEKPLTREEVEFIMECGRLSPSSFGLEHWHFFAVESEPLKDGLYRACFSQDTVSTAALVVVIACRKAQAYDPKGRFVSQRGSRFPGTIEEFIADYEGYYHFLEKSGLLNHWARSQCYIPCANMMTGAAYAGIDSCAIEGYNEQEVLEVLEIDSSVWEIGIVSTFGHRDEEPREHIREPAERIITYL
ncbi:MAG: NAD(P)H-dependent oxidoreductase [Spirochaetaceae bacterium]|jgi:nitroreductase|nr:NAD(P)H-dependent oxidoreductase [Spirochaetaceae bacterium]